MITHLARRAERDRLEVEWVGVDPDPRAIEVAVARRAPASVRFVRTDSSELLVAGERFDLVLSNHVLHHLESDELDRFAEESRALSGGIVLHGDIERGRLAYGLYAIGVTPFAPGTFLRTDGLRSIRRSYLRDELATVLGPAWQVEGPGRSSGALAVAPGTARCLTVVVVGAGPVGALVAAELQRRGVAVRALDAGDPRPASGRGRSACDAPVLAACMEESRE